MLPRVSPSRNSIITPQLNGSLSTRVEESAYLETLVKQGGFQLMYINLTLYDMHDVTSPLESGDTALKTSFHTPNYRKAPIYDISLWGYTVDHKELSCLRVRVDSRFDRY
ncbi:hypothetical protein ABVK25_004815 [Lepraria finkii]|uniref:Uncharacterized protein n=1 Tax=Lepraria finkii TaxID=1340010 RepID=A0ABR4BC37_9LECA